MIERVMMTADARRRLADPEWSSFLAGPPIEQQAACKGSDPERVLPGARRTGGHLRSPSVPPVRRCRRLPEWALSVPARLPGVWGGTTERGNAVALTPGPDPETVLVSVSDMGEHEAIETTEVAQIEPVLNGHTPPVEDAAAPCAVCAKPLPANRQKTCGPVVRRQATRKPSGPDGPGPHRPS